MVGNPSTVSVLLFKDRHAHADFKRVEYVQDRLCSWEKCTYTYAFSSFYVFFTFVVFRLLSVRHASVQCPLPRSPHASLRSLLSRVFFQK